jgi:hypothetical protein
MNKKFRFLSILTVGVLLISCSNYDGLAQDDDDLKMNEVSIPFINTSDEYDVDTNTLNLYRVEGVDRPYVSLLDFFDELDGFFNTSRIFFSLKEWNNTLDIYYGSGSDISYTCTISREKDTVKLDDLDMLYSLDQSRSQTDFSYAVKGIYYNATGGNEVNFSLADYGFDVLYNDGKVLMPLVIANMLFCSQSGYNLIYNGDELYGVLGELSSSSSLYKTIYTSSYNGREQTSESREDSYNSLLFLLDYFYGLKKYKGIEHFNDYIDIDYKEDILSLNAGDNLEGYHGFLDRQLNELHTRLDTTSIYYPSIDAFDGFYLETYGKTWQSYYSLSAKLAEKRKERWGDDGPDIVRFFDDTAIIYLDSFLAGSDDQLYDDERSIKDDAYLYDSYFLMQKAMAEVKKHSEVKDILLDLSSNGGGYLVAFFRVLGFLSDDTFDYSTYDTLSKIYADYGYEIDTDLDGIYADDAYEQYRWSILTSINTFSAANAFVSECKEKRIAKTIGEASGGGMCSILTSVLSDGTLLTISSNNTLRYLQKDGDNMIYQEIESGFDPDIELSNDYFYDDSKLVEYIDKAYDE